MKKIILIASFLLPMLMLSQTYTKFVDAINYNFDGQGEKDSIVKNESRWSFGIEGSPNYSYRKLNFTQPHNENQSRYDYMQKLNREEVPFFGYGFGITANRKIRKRTSLQFGINFSKFNYRSIQFDTLFYTPLGFDPASGPSTWYMIQARYYLMESYYNIPIAVQYTCVKKRVSFVSDLGISFGLFNQKQFAINQVGEKKQSEDILNEKIKFACAINCKVGVGYVLTRHFTILLQPRFTYVLSSFSVAFPITKNVYSFGSNFTMLYNF